MPPKKRLSLAEKINRIVEAGEFVVFQTIEELGRESDEYRGLRFHAKKTQLDQDRVLNTYRQFVKAFFDRDLLGDDPTEEQLDLSCFPDNHATFYHRSRRFLIFMIAQANPRSSQDEHITYRTACLYRRHILFWMNRKYVERNANTPRSAKVYNELTEAMRGAAMSRQLGRASTSKAYIGLAEIQFMIDLDMKSTPSIEVAEQHHLAWCVGRATALRPSSFGPQPDTHREQPGRMGYDDFIRWKDVYITRGSKPGMFDVCLKIRNLKTTRIDPEASVEGPNELAFRILSPQNKANIPFSVSHRLLMIALRRNALEGIETLEQLFSGDLANIVIREDFLNKPIFLAATHRGLSVKENKPMPANALTNYIQIRGRAAGFPDKITFYSIRRRMASDLANSFGNDAAREIMGHSPSSRVLETYYLEFNNMRHTAAVGLGEAVEGQDRELRAALHEQLLRRLDGNFLEKSRGEALNRLVQEALDGDDDFAKLEDRQQIMNYIRRTRRFCYETLWKQLRDEAERSQTIQVLEQRKTEVLENASDFAQRVMAAVGKAKATSRPGGPSPDMDENIDTQNIDFDKEFPENSETMPEDDVEGRDLDAGVDILVRMDEGSQDDDEEVNRAASYLDVARTFMEILSTHSLSTYLPNEKLKCPLCEADSTIPQEQKDQERLLVHHKVHLGARLHSSYEKFRRTTEAAMTLSREREPGKVHRYECPFCTQIYPDDCSEKLQSFYRFDYLARHIEESNNEFVHGFGAWKLDERLIEEHDFLKREASWYEEDFYGDERVIARQLAAQRKTDAKAAGVNWSNEPELRKGIPVETFPGLVRGGPAILTDEILVMYDGYVIEDRPSNRGFRQTG